APARRPRIAGDLADPQMIAREPLEPALLLHAVVLAVGAPADHRFLVATSRERQQAALGALALEALVVDETVDRLELGLELFGEIEIVVPALRLRLHFENHCEHGALLIFLSLLTAGAQVAPAGLGL